MSRTNTFTVNMVDRKNRLANTGKLPKSGGSRRSDRIRSISDSFQDEIGLYSDLDDMSYDDDMEYYDDMSSYLNERMLEMEISR